MLAKKVLHYTLLSLLVLIVGYSFHFFILNYFEVIHPFQIWKIYIFQFFATLILCISFEIIARTSEKYREQLGFLYLGAMVLKIAVFCLFFSDILFSSHELSKVDSFSLLVPIFLFLFLEVIIIVRILNNKL
ncbi:DUF6168 family protein [Aequorivita aurantiaca]|uniref:DUF6168 family protein n=1 Tax=Aequorivita aurantiaca TaxID=3053356 RepID=UPI00338E9565